MVRRYVVAPHGGRGAYSDIGSALRSAARDRAARIEIGPGRYEETLAVHGTVELVALGEPGSVVVSPAQGSALTASGAVSVRGLVLVGRGADAVDCRAGTLTLDGVEVHAHGGVCVHARRGTSVTLTDGQFRYGRVLFAGAAGVVERCRFVDAADNALAVIEGARVTVRDSRIEGSRIHGLRVSDASATVTGCEFTRIEKAALAADTRAELVVAHCTITAVHADALYFLEQSRGLVHDTRVTDAENGISVESGADPVVRRCVFTGCRDTGINVQPAGRGTFEECEVVDAGGVSVFSTGGATPRIDGCRISGGNVGVAVMDKGRGDFARIDIENLTSVALRVREGSRAVFQGVDVRRCAAGLEVLGDPSTTVELADARFGDCSMAAVAAGGRSRITLRDVLVRGALLGFGSVEEAQLRLRDCAAAGVRVGALATGTSTFEARGLAVTDADGVGLLGRDSAFLDVAASRFADCAVGIAAQGESRGRVADCSVTGTGNQAAQHNGLIELVSLDTSLPVVESAPEPAAPPPTTVVNNYYGPVINDAVTNCQFFWNNTQVIQRTDRNGADT
ncbi:right-handed parallel beta-helix repeat-containing protein [Streptomyces phaeofaciens]|uniref:right-handed parallel beta-helix repeat-containing protein n=1 Tax=Streptomyces phaeofaciens TaxID=68254 RepID=UPI0036867378